MLIGDKMVVQCECHVKKCMKADDVGVGWVLGAVILVLKMSMSMLMVGEMQRSETEPWSSEYLESRPDTGNQPYSSSSSSSSFFPQFHTSQMCS